MFGFFGRLLLVQNFSNIEGRDLRGWFLFGRFYVMDIFVMIFVLDILGPGIVILSFFLSLEVNELCFLIVAMFDYFDLGAIQLVVTFFKFEEVVTAIRVGLKELILLLIFRG